MKSATHNNAFLFKLSLASVLLFIITALLVFVFQYRAIDDAVFDGLQDKHRPSVSGFMLFITFFGKHSFLVPANLGLTLLFLFWNNKPWALRTLVISIGGVSLMGLLKNLFARHRPTAPMVEGITNYGFPSGHAMMSVAFYGLLMVFFLSYTNNKWLKQAVVFFLLLAIITIGFSRIYLRLHYTTDVVAGYSVGLSWLCLCLYMANRIEAIKQQKA